MEPWGADGRPVDPRGRQEVRQTAAVLKRFRVLCKSYGEDFSPEDAGTCLFSKKSKARSESPGSQSSSSSSEAPVEKGERFVLQSWSQLEEQLDQNNTTRRHHALHSINKAVQASLHTAEEFQEELDRRGEEEQEEADDALLSFSTATLPAVEAIHRCLGRLPALQERVRRAARARTPQQLSESEESSASSDASGTGKGRVLKELERKMRRYESLPPGTDPMACHVLVKQQERLRELGRLIDADAEELETHKMALDCLNERKRPEGFEEPESDLRRAALALVEEKRDEIYQRRWHGAKKDMTDRRDALGITTEQEVQAVEDDCNSFAAGAHHSVSLLESPPPAEGLDALGEAPKWLIAPEKAFEEKARLIKEQQKLASDLEQIDRRADELRGNLSRAEAGVKKLEELKALFLVHVAREQPHMIGEGFHAAGSPRHLTPSDSENEAVYAEPDPEEAQRLRARISRPAARPEEPAQPTSGTELAAKIREAATALQAAGTADDGGEEVQTEELSRRLQGLRCRELRELLRLRTENERLATELLETTERLERTSHQQGIPRELLCLRRRWWSVRQELQRPLGRRALAMPLDSSVAATAPKRSSTLVSRLTRSRTSTKTMTGP